LHLQLFVFAQQGAGGFIAFYFLPQLAIGAAILAFADRAGQPVGFIVYLHCIPFPRAACARRL